MSNPNPTNQHRESLSRRGFLAGTAGAGLTAAFHTSASSRERTNESKKNPPVVFFTKHMGWMGYNELADTMADIGFDGADLTVRPGGHVLPDNVERDLPKAVEAIRKAGLDVYMISTQIDDADDPIAVNTLKTASALGIRFYRIGAWRYDGKRGVLEQLNEYKPKLDALAELNAKYKMCAVYHNHSGPRCIGGPVWDLFEMIRHTDPAYIGSNFDIGHAVAEGASGAWETNTQLIAGRIRTASIKDIAFVNDPEKGWQREYPPVGQGMVDWAKALRMFKAIQFQGPFSMHFEYEEHGATEEEIRKKSLAAYRRDLNVFREKLREADLA